MSPHSSPTGDPASNAPDGSDSASSAQQVDPFIPRGAEIPPGPGQRSRRRWPRLAAALASCALLFLAGGYAFATSDREPAESVGGDTSEQAPPATAPSESAPPPSVGPAKDEDTVVPAEPEQPAETPTQDAPEPQPEPDPTEDPPDSGGEDPSELTPEELADLVEDYLSDAPEAPR